MAKPASLVCSLKSCLNQGFKHRNPPDCQTHAHSWPKMILVLIVICGQPAVHAQQPEIHIDLSQKGPELNEHMYGIFLEEINHAIDGGLYAELVRNRDFEASIMPEGAWYEGNLIRNKQGFKEPAPFTPPSPLEGWQLAPGSEENARISVDTSNPYTESNPHSLRFEVSENSQGPAGFYNSGYWGILIEDGESYTLRFAARSEDYRQDLHFKLIHPSGKVLAEKSLSGISETWKEYSATLTAKGGYKRSQLLVQADPVSRKPMGSYCGGCGHDRDGEKCRRGDHVFLCPNISES